MMRKKKNRKKESGGVIFPAPLAIVLTVLIVLALTYLWLCSCRDSLGSRIKVLEKKKAEIHNRVINEEYKWSNLKSPRNIETFLQRHNLGMTWPDESRIVRVHNADATVSALAQANSRQFAKSKEAVVND